MKRIIKYISVLMLAIICCMPMIVSAEPDEYTPSVSVETFIINNKNGEEVTATMLAVADTEIEYEYTISVVTNISQDGKEVAKGRGKTGEEQEVTINMSGINSHSSYRFKIVLNYTVNGADEFCTAFSKEFEYTQESFAEELSGKDITVDMTGSIITIDWSRYMRRNAEAVLVIISEDGEGKVEEVVYSENREYYEYYCADDAKKVVITLKQVIDGKLSEGITEAIDLVKDESSNEFYLIFPEGKEQYNRIWSVEYRNGIETSLVWKSDKKNGKLTLSDNGTFLIEMEEDNKSLHVEYRDDRDILWTYDFQTDLSVYAPNISFLEAYNGSTVKSSELVLAGKIDDSNATITLNGNAAEVDANGLFQGKVTLNTGKNVVTVEATNAVGKTARKTVVIYKESGSTLLDTGNVFVEYMPLIITLGVSIVAIVVLIIASKRKAGPRTKGQKGEKNEKKA